MRIPRILCSLLPTLPSACSGRRHSQPCDRPGCAGTTGGRVPHHRLRQGRQAHPRGDAATPATGRRSRRPACASTRRRRPSGAAATASRASGPAMVTESHAGPSRCEPRPREADAPGRRAIDPRPGRDPPGLDRSGGELAGADPSAKTRDHWAFRRPSGLPCLRSRARTWRGTRSTASSSPGSKPRGCRPRPRPTGSP